jgi:hypothetical protein
LRIAGETVIVGISVSLAMNASDVPFKLVWNAGVAAVEGGETGKLDAVENV